MLLGAGCGDRPATAPPEASELERADAPAMNSMYVARGYLVKRTFTLPNDTATTATITPEGGFLSFPEAGLLLYFPKGAVSETIQVTATALKGNRVAYDFQPHGITFNTPIYVAQELLRTELNTPRANKKRPDVWAGYLYNGTDDILTDGSANFTEVFDAFYYGKGSETLAVFTTTHFSGYAMASGRRETAAGVE
jgi:hypothetical protein